MPDFVDVLDGGTAGWSFSAIWRTEIDLIIADASVSKKNTPGTMMVLRMKKSRRCLPTKSHRTSLAWPTFCRPCVYRRISEKADVSRHYSGITGAAYRANANGRSDDRTCA
ncbi:hypothetical protein ACNKHK_19355 [Shigella flexneri]